MRATTAPHVIPAHTEGEAGEVIARRASVPVTHPAPAKPANPRSANRRRSAPRIAA
jgi:hypothetical protein